MPAQGMDLRVRLIDGVHRELIADLETIDGAGRTERLRALAMIGLAVIARQGGLNTAPAAAIEVPGPPAAGAPSKADAAGRVRSKALALKGKTQF